MTSFCRLNENINVSLSSLGVRFSANILQYVLSIGYVDVGYHLGENIFECLSVFGFLVLLLSFFALAAIAFEGYTFLAFFLGLTLLSDFRGRVIFFNWGHGWINDSFDGLGVYID